MFISSQNWPNCSVTAELLLSLWPRSWSSLWLPQNFWKPSFSYLVHGATSLSHCYFAWNSFRWSTTATDTGRVVVCSILAAEAPWISIYCATYSYGCLLSPLPPYITWRNQNPHREHYTSALPNAKQLTAAVNRTRMRQCLKTWWLLHVNTMNTLTAFPSTTKCERRCWSLCYTKCTHWL